MPYNEKPWTLEAVEPVNLKQKREEIQAKEVGKKIEENLPVSVARIVKFLDKNKSYSYTNAQIAKETGISVSLVSGVTDKLEGIGVIQPGLRKAVGKNTVQTYQSALANSGKFPKERLGKEVIEQVLDLFNKNVNKIWSKSDIVQATESTKNKVGQALSILLVTGQIKAVGINEGVLLYQSINGNKRPIEIHTEPNSAYTTLRKYLNLYNIKGDVEEIKAIINEEKGHSRLFYSDKGIVKEYEVEYLQHVVGNGIEKKKEKKGLFEHVLLWGKN